MNSIPFKKKKKKKCKKEKIERQHSVRLSRISISEATRSAHRSSRARAPFHFFLSSGLFIPFFSLSLSPPPSLYPLLLSRDSSLPFLCFSFFPFSLSVFVFDQSRRFLYISFRISYYLVGGSPRASASFTKKGARREARGEERRFAGS